MVSLVGMPNFTVSGALLVTPARVALTSPVWVVAGITVVMVKVALVLPAGRRTLVGQVAAEFEHVSGTVLPPDGAAPFSVTLPVTFAPPKTVSGVSVTAVGINGR